MTQHQWFQCRIEEAETNLRKLLAEHKQMYTAEQQQQEQQEHQQAAAQQRTVEAKRHSRRYSEVL